MGGFNYLRLPPILREQLKPDTSTVNGCGGLAIDNVYLGDSRQIMKRIAPSSIALSVWSPPYYVGKKYERNLTFETWKKLLQEIVNLHFAITRPGGFLAINIADILCFRDETMPRIQAPNPKRNRSEITQKTVLMAMQEHPDYNRYQIAKLLGCSEQTVDRRLNGNNIRGGKYQTQTRVKIVGGLVEEWALSAGFYPYDRRIWRKDACWENSQWSSLSYRSVDEFEYIYIFWKPGITTVDRDRLSAKEWVEWGSRGVWEFPSVRTNDDHESKFPVELPRRVIKLFSSPGDTVLDCFFGSGTMGVAALLEQRNFIGIEIDPDSCKLAEANLFKVKAQLEQSPLPTL